MSLDENTNKIAAILAKANALPDRLDTSDTSDATATAEDIVAGQTAYVNGNKITGTLPDYHGTEITVVDKFQTNFRFMGKPSNKSYLRNTQQTLGTIPQTKATALLGDATPSDVAKGKTFTSGSGDKADRDERGSGSAQWEHKHNCEWHI